MVSSRSRFAALGVLALLASGCDIQAQSNSVDGSFDRTLTVNGPIDLDVFSRSGRIQIQVGPDNAVHVVGRIRAYGSLTWLGSYTPAEQVEALETAPPIDQTGNAIIVGDIRDQALASGVSISYDITVPANTRLRTSSRSGDQTIGAIAGPVTASSRSGSVHVTRVAGDVDVETRSGNIELLDQTSRVRASSRSGHVRLEGQPSRTWVVETRSGNVDLRLPPDGSVDVDVQTRSGSVDSDRPIQMHGMRSRRRIQGTVGKGGGRLEVSTTSGSVRIR